MDLSQYPKATDTATPQQPQQQDSDQDLGMDFSRYSKKTEMVKPESLLHKAASSIVNSVPLVTAMNAMHTMAPAYDAVKNPLVDMAMRTAPIPAALNMMGDNPISVQNPIGMFTPPGTSNLIPPIQTSGRDLSKRIAGTGIDTMAMLGGEGALNLGEKALDAAGGAIKGVGDFGEGMKSRSMIKNGTDIQESVRQRVTDKFLGRTKDFEQKLSQLPEASHDVTDEVNRLKRLSEVNPSIKDAIDNSPIAKKLMYGSETGTSKIVDNAGNPIAEQIADQSNKVISTKNLQNLRNELGKNYDYADPGHDWQLGKELGSLRLKQAEPFPEEMGAIAKDYKDTLKNYGAVRPYLRESRLGSALLKGFGGEGGAETRNALDYFLKDKSADKIFKAGQTMETVKDLNPFRKIVKLR